MTDQLVKQAARAVAALSDDKKLTEDDLQPATSKSDLEMPHYANMVKLTAADGQMFYIDFEAACVSGTVAQAMEACGYTKDTADIEIPLANVTGNVLALIMQWMRRHRNAKPAEEKSQFLRRMHMFNYAQYKRAWILPSLSKWEAEFLSNVVRPSRLLEVYRAAHYMDIEGLSRVCAKFVAMSVRDGEAMRIRNNWE